MLLMVDFESSARLVADAVGDVLLVDIILGVGGGWW